MRKIAFEYNKFKEWLNKQDCDCDMFPAKLEGAMVVRDWESDINGKITKYHDVELYGEVIDYEKPV